MTPVLYKVKTSKLEKVQHRDRLKLYTGDVIPAWISRARSQLFQNNTSSLVEEDQIIPVQRQEGNIVPINVQPSTTSIKGKVKKRPLKIPSTIKQKRSVSWAKSIIKKTRSGRKITKPARFQ